MTLSVSTTPAKYTARARARLKWIGLSVRLSVTEPRCSIAYAVSNLGAAISRLGNRIHHDAPGDYAAGRTDYVATTERMNRAGAVRLLDRLGFDTSSPAFMASTGLAGLETEGVDGSDRPAVLPDPMETLTEPAYARRDDCPTWCTTHKWDVGPGHEPIFEYHAATSGEGDDELELFLSKDGELGACDMGNRERTPERCRAFAAQLLEAADVLETERDPLGEDDVA